MTEKGVDDQSYIVYVDRMERVSRIHRLECDAVYQNCGVSHGPRPTSWYIGFFDEREAAEWVATRLAADYPVDFHGCSQ